MLPREVITIKQGDHPPILSPSARTARYALRGTFEQWRDNAARLAGQHTLGVFRMSTALASPLLKLAGQEGGVFHLWGTSSGGKSTLDFLASTVWGRGTREGGFSRTWSSTANGFENTAAAGNDIAIFLDDTSHVIDARTIVQVIYMVSGGQGKTRMRADKSPSEGCSISHHCELERRSCDPYHAQRCEDLCEGRRRCSLRRHRGDRRRQRQPR